MPGDVDPLFIAARRALLDAIDALGPHRTSLVLVGAQAVYLHAGEADLAVAPFTKDGDLMLDPRTLAPDPKLIEAMMRAGFAPSEQPDTWVGGGAAQIDLLVPEAFGGSGRRGARLEHHGSRAARKARGLEGALVDRDARRIEALEPADRRVHEIAVAGPSALMVAKLHKIAERVSQPGRLKDKDALDVLRILRAVEPENLSARFARLLADPISREVTEQAITHLRVLFGTRDGLGSSMAVRATEGLEDEEIIATSCEGLAQDLLEAMGTQ